MVAVADSEEDEPELDELSFLELSSGLLDDSSFFELLSSRLLVTFFELSSRLELSSLILLSDRVSYFFREPEKLLSSPQADNISIDVPAITAAIIIFALFILLLLVYTGQKNVHLIITHYDLICKRF